MAKRLKKTLMKLKVSMTLEFWCLKWYQVSTTSWIYSLVEAFEENWCSKATDLIQHIINDSQRFIAKLEMCLVFRDCFSSILELKVVLVQPFLFRTKLYFYNNLLKKLELHQKNVVFKFLNKKLN